MQRPQGCPVLLRLEHVHRHIVGGVLCRTRQRAACYWTDSRSHGEGLGSAADNLLPATYQGGGDGLWTEARGQQKQSNDPGNNQHNPQYANYWAPLTHKRHTLPHPAPPAHQLLGSANAEPRTRKRHQQEHRPQRLTESSDPTQHAEGRTGDCPGPRKGATTRRNVTQGGGVPNQFGGGKFGGSKEQGRRHGARMAQGDGRTQQEAPGFGVGNVAAKLKRQMSHTKVTAHHIPPPRRPPYCPQ